MRSFTPLIILAIASSSVSAAVFQYCVPVSVDKAPSGNIKSDSGPIDLKATSDARLPVEYYVAYGPGEIAGGKLKISELPRSATFPIRLKVVAWQFGSGVEPLVRTACPVEQTIWIEKP